MILIGVCVCVCVLWAGYICLTQRICGACVLSHCKTVLNIVKRYDSCEKGRLINVSKFLLLFLERKVFSIIIIPLAMQALWLTPHA